MQILVTTVSGKTIKFDVETLSTVRNVSTSTLSEGNPTELGASLYCRFVETKLQVSIKTVGGMRVTFEVESSPTSEKVDRIDEGALRRLLLNSLRSDFHDIKMETIVKTMTGKTHTLVVRSYPNRMIRRSTVHDTEGISPELSTLHCNFLDVNVRISLNSVTGKTIILEVDSLDGVTVNVQTSIEKQMIPMQIFVNTERGKTITVDVEPSDTIDIVKRKIADKDKVHGLSQNRQRLIYQGHQLYDRNTIADYGVLEHDSLHQSRKLCPDSPNDYFKSHRQTTEIMIQREKTLTEGKKIKVAFEWQDNIGDVEKKIEDQTLFLLQGSSIEDTKGLATCSVDGAQIASPLDAEVDEFCRDL